MQDLQKVNSYQLYSFWKNLSIGVLVMIALMAFSHMLPFYASPIIAILAAGFLYGMMYNDRIRQHKRCMIVIYALMYSIVNYTVVTVALNLLSLFNAVQLPRELEFINDPYIPSLLVNPIACLTLTIIYFRRNKIRVCDSCGLKAGGLYEMGRNGRIFRYESSYQIKNLAILFGIISAIVWAYYQFVYIELSVSTRDSYVFAWLYIIAFLFDELYFVYRYYNLYLDLKDSDMIITPEELQDMTSKTYIRYYVICDNSIYFDEHFADPQQDYREVINTPFTTKQSVSGIPLPEVKSIIQKMTGVSDGTLRFFFGRKSADLKNHSLLRYFYFLPGKPEDYKDMPTKGEWMNFEEVKKLYSRTPTRFNPLTASDISRLATIILTEKLFNEDGRRKNKIKSYNPSFNLHDVRRSELDFQDDKWIRIAMFNSDTPFYSIKKFFRGKAKDQQMINK